MRIAILLLVVAALGAGEARAQDPFKRKAADPGTESKIARIKTKGSRIAGGSLKADDASRFAVRKDCGPVQIGGAQANQQQPKSLLRNQASERENNTVTGDVVVICRQ